MIYRLCLNILVLRTERLQKLPFWTKRGNCFWMDLYDFFGLEWKYFLGSWRNEAVQFQHSWPCWCFLRTTRNYIFKLYNKILDDPKSWQDFSSGQKYAIFTNLSFDICRYHKMPNPADEITKIYGDFIKLK
jgi:hypothetical protein